MLLERWLLRREYVVKGMEHQAT